MSVSPRKRNASGHVPSSSTSALSGAPSSRALPKKMRRTLSEEDLNVPIPRQPKQRGNISTSQAFPRAAAAASKRSDKKTAGKRPGKTVDTLDPMAENRRAQAESKRREAEWECQEAELWHDFDTLSREALLAKHSDIKDTINKWFDEPACEGTSGFDLDPEIEDIPGI